MGEAEKKPVVIKSYTFTPLPSHKSILLKV